MQRTIWGYLARTTDGTLTTRTGQATTETHNRAQLGKKAEIEALIAREHAKANGLRFKKIVACFSDGRTEATYLSAEPPPEPSTPAVEALQAADSDPANPAPATQASEAQASASTPSESTESATGGATSSEHAGVSISSHRPPKILDFGEKTAGDPEPDSTQSAPARALFEADLREPKRLLDSGMHLVALKHMSKQPKGDGWNLDSNAVKAVEPFATGYGLPLAANGLCSVDPDNLELAKIGMDALGLNLEEIMAAGVRTKSTRHGSGGRSTFRVEPDLSWIKFSSPDAGTVLELRADSPNLQDAIPGVVYVSKDGEVCTQSYANDLRLDDAPALPDAFLELWQRCSTDIDFLREAQRKFFDAIGSRPIQSISTGRKGGKLAYDALGYRAAFNEAHKVESILDRHGYGYDEKSKRWYPATATGAPSVRPIPGKDGLWRSDHASDPLCGTFDAWTAHVQLDHNGDVEAAKKAFDVETGVDQLNESGIVNQPCKPPESPQGGVLDAGSGTAPRFSFDLYALNGRSSDMRKQMLDDAFVLGRLAILGQITAWFAEPNAGKTLMVIALLIKAIESKTITAADVYYINADDNFAGLVTKLEIAERYGFKMLSPGHGGAAGAFDPNDFQMYLRRLIADGTARGVVLVLDTLKKFADCMDKKTSTEFMKVVREFSLHGGTVIFLAHVNKHRGTDGKLVAAGTTDIKDDSDCAYILDVVSRVDGITTVNFENIKSRGDNAQSVSYKYVRREGQSYADLVASVSLATDSEVKAAREEDENLRQLHRNHEAIQIITEVINDGVSKKTDLIAAAADRSVLSKNKIKKALHDHTGTDYLAGARWFVKKSGDRNTQEYQLLPLAGGPDDDESAAYERASNGASC